MMGRPKDVPGQCNAHLYICDDFGDNEATMRCHLPKDHEGKHKEIFSGKDAIVEWAVDEKRRDL